MYLFANMLQLLLLVIAVIASSFAILQLAGNGKYKLQHLEFFHWLVSGILVLISAILLHALYWQDFSLQYVANYTDQYLALFYRLTAFWAGQPGSMLFWAVSVAVMTSIFAYTSSYQKLSSATKFWFWAFYYVIIAFFALILTSWSNPFLLYEPTPPDGNGLNPLLQNPGMILHPPLLFLGYAGFTVPSCLALAQAMSAGRAVEEAWYKITRAFLIYSWIFLTAGIILGMWWAYMELGWGGYWAWDPVENASLLPWLIGSAVLHTLIIEEKRGKLIRTNVALMGLCTVSAFFATWLVRSGVIQSVHAFGDGGVGLPLLVFILVSMVVCIWAAFCEPKVGEPMDNSFASREGMLILVAWILLSLAIIILIATMWPVISTIWSDNPKGLDERFYNRVCLPLSTILLIAMAACPWLGWQGGVVKKFPLVMGCGVAVIGVVACLYWISSTEHSPQVLSLIAFFASLACFAACIYQTLKALKAKHFKSIGRIGVHAGIAIMAMGIALSGPYKTEKDLALAEGEKTELAGYEVTMLKLKHSEEPGYQYIEANLQIAKNGQVIGNITPQRRIYEKFGDSQFSEVDVIPSLTQEIYASLLGLDGSRVVVRISLEPAISWLWIGGTIMCLLPFLIVFARNRKDKDLA